MTSLCNYVKYWFEEKKIWIHSYLETIWVKFRKTTPSRVTFCTNASTAPVQTFGTGILQFAVQRQYRFSVQAQYLFLPRQYRQTTPSRVTFRTNTSTKPFSTQYYASTTPVPSSARRYWRGTKSVVNFHLGNSKQNSWNSQKRYTKAIICLFWRKIYLNYANIYLSQRYIVF